MMRSLFTLNALGLASLFSIAAPLPLPHHVSYQLESFADKAHVITRRADIFCDVQSPQATCLQGPSHEHYLTINFVAGEKVWPIMKQTIKGNEWLYVGQFSGG